MVDLANDEIVGVDVTRTPVEVVIVGWRIGVVVSRNLQANRDIGETLVEVAVLCVKVERDDHLDVFLWELHDAILTLKPEGGLTCLMFGEIVVGYFHAAIEAEDLIGTAGGGGDAFGFGEAGVVGADVPGTCGQAGVARISRGDGGLIAGGLGDETGRGDADGQMLNVCFVGGEPLGGVVNAKADFRVKMVEGQRHITVEGGASEVVLDQCWCREGYRVMRKEVVVIAFSGALNLSDEMGFCHGVCGCDHTVVAGLGMVVGINLERHVSQSNTRWVGWIRSDGVETVGEVAVVPELLVLTGDLRIIPIGTLVAVPSGSCGLVFHVIVLHHGLLFYLGKSLVGRYHEVRREQNGGACCLLHLILL